MNKQIKIELVEANEKKIKALEKGSALTFEGMNLSKENIDMIANLFIKKRFVADDKDQITGYTWSGSTMNNLYHLTGNNRYKDDMSFLAFELKSFYNPCCIRAFDVGARWLDDIVENNASRELIAILESKMNRIV